MVAESTGNGPRRESSFIAEAVKKALSNFPDNYELRVNFAKAMYMAVKLDKREKRPPRPFNYLQIQSETNIPLDQQYAYSVLLGKEEALNFLTIFGVITSASAFRKRHTGRNMFARFGYNPAKVSNKIVCTYAEWLHAENFLFEPQLPPEILELLPDGYKPSVPLRNE